MSRLGASAEDRALCAPKVKMGNSECCSPPLARLPPAASAGAPPPGEAQLAWRALARQAWEIARLYYEGPERRIAWFNLGFNLLLQALMSLLFVVVSYTQARPPAARRA